MDTYNYNYYSCDLFRKNTYDFSPETKLVIIGLHGEKKVGKDTFFRLAKELITTDDFFQSLRSKLRCDINVMRFAFADRLKDICCDIFKLKRSELDMPHLKDDATLLNGHSFRDILCKVGACIRPIYPNFLTNEFRKFVFEQFENKNDSLSSSYQEPPITIIFITDLRLKNEYNEIMKYPKLYHINNYCIVRTIRIVRSNNNSVTNPFLKIQGEDHNNNNNCDETENKFPDQLIDYKVENPRTELEYKNNIRETLKQIFVDKK